MIESEGNIKINEEYSLDDLSKDMVLDDNDEDEYHQVSLDLSLINDSPPLPKPVVSNPFNWSDRVMHDKLFAIFFCFFTLFSFFRYIWQIFFYSSTPISFLMLLCLCFIAALVGIVCLCMWIWFNQYLLSVIQSISFLFIFFCTIWLFIFCFELGLILLILLILILLWFYFANKENQFVLSRELLVIIGDYVQKHPSLIVLLFILLFFQTLWSVLWSYYVLSMVNSSYFLIWSLNELFSFYWISQFTRYNVHCMVSAVFANWYYQLPSSDAGSQIALISLLSIGRYHFGSVSLGSLVVPTIRVFWGIIRRFHPNCLYYRIQTLFFNFNKYGFSHMIIKGDSFNESSSNTYHNLLYANGLDQVIYEDKLDILVMIPAIASFCLLMMFSGIWCIESGYNNWLITSFLLGCVGLATVTLTTEVIEASDCSLFYCFSQNPEYLYKLHPIIYHRMCHLAEFTKMTRSDQIYLNHQIRNDNDGL